MISKFEEGLKQLGWTNKLAAKVLQKDPKTIYRWRKSEAPLVVLLLMSVMLARHKEGKTPEFVFYRNEKL